MGLCDIDLWACDTGVGFSNLLLCSPLSTDQKSIQSLVKPLDNMFIVGGLNLMSVECLADDNLSFALIDANLTPSTTLESSTLYNISHGEGSETEKNVEEK